MTPMLTSEQATWRLDRRVWGRWYGHSSCAGGNGCGCGSAYTNLDDAIVVQFASSRALLTPVREACDRVV